MKLLDSSGCNYCVSIEKLKILSLLSFHFHAFPEWVLMPSWEMEVEHEKASFLIYASKLVSIRTESQLFNSWLLACCFRINCEEVMQWRGILNRLIELECWDDPFLISRDVHRKLRMGTQSIRVLMMVNTQTRSLVKSFIKGITVPCFHWLWFHVKEYHLVVSSVGLGEVDWLVFVELGYCSVYGLVLRGFLIWHLVVSMQTLSPCVFLRIIERETFLKSVPTQQALLYRDLSNTMVA